MPTNKASGAGDDETTPPSTALAKKPIKKKNNQGVETPDEVKAAIISALLSGQFQTDKEAAKAIGVHPGVVSKYKKLIPAEYLEQVLADKKDAIGEKIMEFLESALEGLKSIDQKLAMNEEWLLRQNAAEIATFYGVKADKVIKILEAIERANEPVSDEVSGSEGS